MTVNSSMLMNVIYIAVISVAIVTRWVGLCKRMAISIVAHLALGGDLDVGKLSAAAVSSRPFIPFN